MLLLQRYSPLYLWSSGICLEMCCTWRSSLTRSMGATVVLEMAADTPPAMKSLAKATGSASAGSMVPSWAGMVSVWVVGALCGVPRRRDWRGKAGQAGETRARAKNTRPYRWRDVVAVMCIPIRWLSSFCIFWNQKAVMLIQVRTSNANRTSSVFEKRIQDISCTTVQECRINVVLLINTNYYCLQ